MDHGLSGPEVESVVFNESSALQREEIPAEKGMGKGVEENRQVADGRQAPAAVPKPSPSHQPRRPQQRLIFRLPPAGVTFPGARRGCVSMLCLGRSCKNDIVGASGAQHGTALGAVHVDSSGNVP